MSEKPPVILTIAGFDPSSGAGVTADIKTIAAHGCYGVACITALTVQSTSGVKRVDAVDAALVTDTLEELAGDLEIAAVHVGMLGSGKVAKAVAREIPPVAPIVNGALQEVVGEAEADLVQKEVEAVVKGAVKEAVEEAVRDAVEVAVERGTAG